jgi:hypothetical protein
MSFHSQAQHSSGNLQRLIERAEAATPDLVSAALDLVLARCEAPRHSETASRIRRLIQSEAWTDAALALFDLEPQLKIRRLTYDAGEWRCTVGGQWPIPEWLDDTVESRHASLPMAILSTLLEGLRMRPPATIATASVPRSQPDPSGILVSMSCDNFG